MPNIGIPEILFVLVVVGTMWLLRRVPVRKDAIQWALIALAAVVAAILVYNYTTTFHAIPLWQK